MKTTLRPFASAGCALLLAVSVPTLSSCSKSGDAAEAAAAEAATPAPSPAEDCLATANAGRAAILEGRLADLHGMMPATWQNDVDGCLRLLSTKIDKPAFGQITGLAGDLAALAEEKSDLIRAWLEEETPVEGRAFTADDVAALGRGLRALSSWKYEDLSEGRFKELFGAPGLADALALFIRLSMADEDASCSEFSVVDPAQTDKVSLRITLTSRDWTFDKESGTVQKFVRTDEETLDWVRFEDRWVPDPLLNPDEVSAGWTAGIQNFRRDIDDISPADVGQLSMAVTMIRMVLPMVKQCETVEDLEQVFHKMR